LKKQSQFAPAPIGVKSFLKGDYDNKPASGAEEYKANFIVLSNPKGVDRKSDAESLGPDDGEQQMRMDNGRLISRRFCLLSCVFRKGLSGLVE